MVAKKRREERGERVRYNQIGSYMVLRISTIFSLLTLEVKYSHLYVFPNVKTSFIKHKVHDYLNTCKSTYEQGKAELMFGVITTAQIERQHDKDHRLLGIDMIKAHSPGAFSVGVLRVIISEVAN